MNIHPILVHFPIALLSLYGLFELVRSNKLMALKEWFYIKFALLFFGLLGAFAALGTGEFGESLYPHARDLIEIHSGFAAATTIAFAVLLIPYLVDVVNNVFVAKFPSLLNFRAWRTVCLLRTSIFRSWMMVVLALVGLGLLFLTGTLGGAIVYGPDTDIFTRFLTGLLLGK